MEVNDILENCEYAHRVYTHHCGMSAVDDFVYCEIDDTVKHVCECSCIEKGDTK